MKTIGIITADIIESTDIDFKQKESVFNSFNEGLEQIKKVYHIKYEWYRGDSLQVKVEDVNNSLRIALMIKFWIKSFEKDNKKSFDARLSLGIGSEEYNKSELSLSDGEAFRISGRNLDSIKNSKQSLIIDSNDTNKNFLLIESLLLNTIIDNVTVIQAKVLFYKLNKYIEEEIASKLGLAQSTINQHSNSGNWNIFAKYLLYFEKLYANV